MFKNILAAIVLAISVGGCSDQTGNTGSDGYRFGEPEYVATEMQIQLLKFDSYTSLREAAEQQGLSDEVTQGIFGFSVINPDTGICIIHTIDPQVKWVPDELGHETAHCFYGQWHTDNKTRN